MPPWERYQTASAPSSGPWSRYAPGPSKQASAKPIESEQGLGRTLLDQGMQGATFGFADEAMDRIGAGLATLSLHEGNDWSNVGAEYNEQLNQARQMSQERLKSQMEQRPITSIAANLAGGLVTGGAGATTKTGATVANSLRAGNAAARIGKGAVAGGYSAGLYGAGAAKEGKRLDGAGQAIPYGAVGGAVIPAVGGAVGSLKTGTSNVIKGARARGAEELEAAAGVIKDQSRQAYSAMRQLGAAISRPRSANIANRVESAIMQSGKINAGLHGNTISVLSDFKNAAKGGNLTLEELDQYRQLFGEVVRKGTDIKGAIDGDALKATKAIDAIDEAVNTLSGIDIRGGSTKAIDALNLGRSEWARARRFETISSIVTKAGGDANTLKRELQKLANDGRMTKGWPKEDLEALKTAAANTAPEKILKSFGKFGFDLGTSLTPGNTALPGIATAAGLAGFGTAPIAIGGTAARQTQKYLARGKTENLLRTIEGTAANRGGGAPVTPLLSAPSGQVTTLGSIENQSVKPTPVVSKPSKAPVASNDFETSGIASAEGKRTAAYNDHLGNRTIGIGFNMDDPSARSRWNRANLSISFDDAYSGKARLKPEEMQRLAMADLLTAEEDARKLVNNFDQLSGPRQDVLKHLAFQLGGSRLAKFRPTLKLIEEGKYGQAAKRLQSTKIAKQTPERVRILARMLTENVPYPG